MRSFVSLLGLSVLVVVLSACDRQAVKPNGSPVQPAPGSTPSAVLQFAPANIERTTVPGGACNFDVIAGQSRDVASITIDRQPSMYDAWAALDVEKGIVGKAVVLQLVGPTVYELDAPRTKRRDVADYFKNPALIDAGFGGKFSATSVPEGTYELRVLIETDGAKWAICTIGRKVIVAK